MMKLSIHDATDVKTVHKGPLGGASSDTSTTDIEIWQNGQLLTITLFHQDPINHQTLILDPIQEES